MERKQYTLTKLRELIGGFDQESGVQLPTERALAERFSVGRRTVRRALDMLEDEGLIQRRQGQGTFISPVANAPFPTGLEFDTSGFGSIVQNTNPIEFMEVRLTVEPLLARLAAMRASRYDINNLNALAEQTRTAKSAEDYERADSEFHHRVAMSAKNSLFLSFFEVLIGMRSEMSWQQLGENNRCFKQQACYATHHQKIANAIAARDSVLSYDLMLEHLSDIQKRFMQHSYAFS
ncbi:MAG: FCD domain-containing protein [Candidatus Tectomicrobia bacterium]